MSIATDKPTGPRTQVARKAHSCDDPGCHRPILPGETYVREATYSNRTHDDGRGNPVQSVKRGSLRKYHEECYARIS